MSRGFAGAVLAAMVLPALGAGDNLLKNPSFEADALPFQLQRYEVGWEKLKNFEDSRYRARPDIAHVKEGDRAYYLGCDNPTGRQLLSFNGLPVEPGKRYTFRCHYWLDAADGNSTVWGNWHQLDAAGRTAAYRNLAHFAVSLAAWNEFECSFFAPTNAVTVNVQMILIGAMEAWVDEASFFEDPPRPLPAPLGGTLGGNDAADFAWLMPVTKATDTGFPKGLKSGDGAVHLEAARNERESFQFVVAAKRELKDVRAELTGLPGEVKLREVKFVPIANSKNAAMNRMHPDPVVGFDSAAVGAGTNLVLLATVKTAKDAKPGLHEGVLRLTAEGGELVSVPVRLRVWDFELPDTARLKSYFYMSPGYGAGGYKTLDPRSDEEICDDIHAHYLEMRLTGNQVAKRGTPKWKLEDGRVVITDWTPFDESVRKLRDRFGFTTIPCPFVGMLGDNAGWFKSKGRGVIKRKSGRTVGDGAPATPFGGFHDEPVGQGRVIDALRQFLDHAKEEYPDIGFSWYIYDEPPLDVIDTLPGVVKAYADALPELNLLIVATSNAFRLEKYTTRVAHFDGFSICPPKVNFDMTWYYQYPSTIDDEAYPANRIFPWRVYRANGCGVLLWNVIWYGSAKETVHSPWTELTALYDDAIPTIFYPPRPGTGEGTVTSMRCINIGDAVDDFDYLKLHEEKFGREATDRLVGGLLPKATDQMPYPSEFLEVRRRIADALSDPAAGTVDFETRPGQRGKKCVAFGWELTPSSPAELLAHADAFMALPLDGVGVRIPKNPAVGRDYDSSTRGNAPMWQKEHMTDVVPQLKEMAKYRCFRSSFLYGLTCPSEGRRYSWENPEDWRTLASNLTVMAYLAREAGFPGIMLDVEDYPKLRQFFRVKGDPPDPVLRAAVRRRAAEIFEPVFREYPSITLLAFFGFSDLFFNCSENDRRQQLVDRGHLWNEFILGIFDMMPPAARFIDGQEVGYKFRAADHGYRGARRQRFDLDLVPPELRVKYLSQCETAFGIYLDMYTRPEGDVWYKPPTDGSRLRTLELDFREALDSSDEYVWWWGEQGDWIDWKRTGGKRKLWSAQLPGLVETLAAAKDPGAYYLPKLRAAIAAGKAENLAAKDVGFWQRPGTAPGEVQRTFDAGEGHRTARLLKGTGDACFVVEVPEVKAGDFVYVAFSVKGFGFRTSVDFVNREADGKNRWRETREYVTTAPGDFDSWRRGERLVEVPEGWNRANVVFSAKDLAPEDAVLFDDLEVRIVTRDLVP